MEPENIEAAAWITQLRVAVVTWLIVAAVLLFGIVLGIGWYAESWLLLIAMVVTYAVGALATLESRELLQAKAGRRWLWLIPYLFILSVVLPQVVSGLHIERIDLVLVLVILPTLEIVILAVWYPGRVRLRRPSRR